MNKEKEPEQDKENSKITAMASVNNNAESTPEEEAGVMSGQKRDANQEDEENKNQTTLSTVDAEEESAKTILPSRPVKRARTAYFIFCDEKRPQIQKEFQGEAVSVHARELGKLWSALSEEEKKVYQNLAADERERVVRDTQAWLAAGGAERMAELAEPSSASSLDATLVFPVARIRKICKLDPEVRGLSKEALLLVTKAAELGLAKLGNESVKHAQIQNRRKLLPDDVAQVCASREQFMFLREDIQDQVREQQSMKESDKVLVEKETVAIAKNPLTSYFSSKSSN